MFKTYIGRKYIYTLFLPFLFVYRKYLKKCIKNIHLPYMMYNKINQYFMHALVHLHVVSSECDYL